MAEAYMGEIRLFGGNYAPRDWALCNGQLLAISSYSALFSLLGTAYGGDGFSTFALPDLRGRIPVGIGTRPGGDTWSQGLPRGSESIAINEAQMPAHNHQFLVSDNEASSDMPENNLVGRGLHYAKPEDAKTLGSLASDAVANAGSGVPHSNMMPYTGLNYIICMVGTYPPRN